MKDDFSVEGFSIPPHPKGATLIGKSVRLEPLNIEKHSEDLYNANIVDVDSLNWIYLPYGPFQRLGDYQKWLKIEATKDDPTFLRLEDLLMVRLLALLAFFE